jgi:curli biogenesis system outer membrane secretion channel CsgG
MGPPKAAPTTFVMFTLRIKRVISLLLIFTFFFGCAPTAQITKGSIQPQQAPYWQKKRIAVMKIGDKTNKGWQRIGEGMADMLNSSLVNTDRFIVLEREMIKDVISEQDLTGGRIIPIGEIEGAELLIYGDITEFEPQKLTAAGVLLGLASLGSVIYSAKSKSKVPFFLAGYIEAHVAMDLRIIDTRTSRIVATTTVEGKASDIGGIIGGVVGGGKTELPIVLGTFAKTPMEKAIRACIDTASEWIAKIGP